MKKALILALSVCGSLLSVTVASSADLIQDYPAKRYEPRAAYVATQVDCERLRIDYRFPYPRYTEVVQVCFPPVDMTPSGISGTGGGGLIYASGRSGNR
ncbi:hypothetical protein ASG39_11290 [Rhizobium sp. Leaf371]|uniref:hypothetical protein n=1 Tax=Rhizobium sp. Leaf371 TaxID=1736355 RepID=UPI0007145F9A|nr:hypothetical protein [Rhizobium sp. Leaf371]KQS64531.1 hypothetical protein ASG39_11290 [Rhizobium sp. Leaf371]